MTPARSPRISVVATSRNDDHGGNLRHRMQVFVSGFIAQCKRHDLSAELILVDWNPPEDRPPLVEALSWPAESGPCDVRVIQVPPALHARLAHSDTLPLFQMIAKNVGLRRARGAFLLATNIDILFSDALCAYLRSGPLHRGHVYRIDRSDVPADVPVDAPIEVQLRYCESEMFRIAGKFTTHDLRTDQAYRVLHPRWPKTFRAVRRMNISRLRKLWTRPQLHTNACGDFTLLAREDWFALRGYAELEIFSLHLDSLFCYAAYYAGLREAVLPAPMRIFHVEHAIGSGWTPEGEQSLYERLDAAGLPWMSLAELRGYVRRMRRKRQPPIFNGEDWGLGGETLPEVWPCASGPVPSALAEGPA